MNFITPKLSGSFFRWFTSMIFLAVLIVLSSCSTNREASLAYMDDIYKSYDANYSLTYYNEQGGVSDQDASVIKPYRPTVPDYYPYAKPINFSMAFGFGSYYPFYGGGYGNYCRPYGYYPAYYSYDIRSYYGCYSPEWYMLPYSVPGYGYFPYYNYGYGDYGGSHGGSFIFGNNVNYFHGINSSDRYKGSNGVNHSNYVYYRAAGASGISITGRQSGSSGKSRYTNIFDNGKSNSNSSNNYNNSSNYNSNRSYQSTRSQSSRSGGSVSPSRSSGSSGGSYSGKRPR